MSGAELSDSGIEWLGSLPRDWEVKRTKAVFREARGRSETGSEELLTVSHLTGVTPRSEKTVNMFEAETTEGYKLCRRNDLAINTMWAWMGALGVSPCDGIVSPSYNVYEPTDASGIKYYDYLFRTPAFIAEINRWSKGVWKSRLRLYPGEFSRIMIPVPPAHVRVAIADFLDKKTAAIDALIEKKERLIALLQEQRLARISQAVTKGLDPNVPMHDSGVEWLGRVPAHWEHKALGAVADVVDPNPSHRNPVYVDNGFPFISTVEFTEPDGIITETPRRVAEVTVEEQERRCRFRRGSIAFSRKGTIGATRLLPVGIRFALLDSVCVINCGRAIDPLFANYQLQAASTRAALAQATRGAALKQISVGRVRRLQMLIPPLPEQQEIARHVQEQTSKIDALVVSTAKSRDLLKEYRNALIAAAVTGQVTVAEEAA